MRLGRIDGLKSQNGNHVPDGESMDTVTFVTEAAGQVYKQTVKFGTFGQLCARMRTLLSRLTGAGYWPT